MKYRDTPHDSKWVLTWSSCFVACFIIRSCTPSLLSPSLSLHPSCLSHTSLIAVLIHFLHCFYFIFFSNYAAICHCRLLDVHFKPLTHSMLGVDGQCLSGHVLACKLLVVQSCPCMGVFLFQCPVVAVPLVVGFKNITVKNTQVQRLRKVKHFRLCSTWAILLSAAPHTLSLFWVLVKTTVNNYLVCSL